MATCPNCHTSSRQDPDAITVEKVLVAKPLGTWSVAGQSLKTVAVEKYKMECRCGWYVLGQLDQDGNLIALSSDQHFPE